LEALAAVRGLTPFVGRKDELRLLMNRWERVLEGEGQVVTIVGEAGIGKSRLVQHFRGQIAAKSHTWVECAAGAFFQNTPFYAITEMLRQSLLWEQRFRALESSLGSTANKRTKAAPLIASLLEPPVTSNSPASSMPPEQQRKQLLAALVAWTFDIAKARPLVIATEDLHWADSSTLELIQLLVEQGATARLMLVCTARPEFRVQWPSRAHHTQINLSRMNARDVLTMVSQVASQKALSKQTIAAVVERTGGVPLFTEELTRAVLESGDAKLTGREIPATLHDSLMTRLDRLGSAKEVIQVGAVIDSDFSYELLHAVHPIAEANLQPAQSGRRGTALRAGHCSGRDLSVQDHFLLGFTLQFLGEFVSARAHCEEGIELYDSKIHHALAFSFGVDPGVNCLSCAPLALWSLGYPDQALQRSREALALAQELIHPFSMGWALIAATWLRQYRREESAVQEQAETAIALATEQGFPFWSAWATILRGWVLTTRGLEGKGIRQIRNGLEVMRGADAAELASTHFLAMLAEGYRKVGRDQEGIAILEEALAAVDKNGERFYEAELYRLKGELLLRNPASETAEPLACFRRALEIARHQSAKSWELRTTMSLARLLAEQGRRDEARKMLAEIYGWFTEGFDTADLKEAKALLAELGG
jgi:tetratricopeptide (TPR) repeat protein